MADLSAYINFSLEFDLVQQKLILTDTGTYLPGVKPTLTGIVTITQPDGITTPPPPSPDVYWDGANLTKATKELRLTAQGTPQQGQYTVLYTIFDGATYTPKQQIFQFSYSKPTQTIKENFDVFTPELSVADITDYAVSGFTATIPTRLWNAVAVGVAGGSISGTGASLDLKVAGSYYDATYNIALSATIKYTHTSYTWLSVSDKFNSSLTAQANTPPSTDDLLGYVDAIKAKVDAEQPCGDDCCSGQCDYILAFTLYRHIRDRICKHQPAGLEEYIQQLLNIYYGYVKDYDNTELPILPYATGDCEGGGGGASAIPLEYIVGSPGAPVDGQATFTVPQMIDRNIMLFIGSILQSKTDAGWGVYYSKPLASDTITLTGQTWSNGSLIQIFIL